jgi:hypothetical protein
MDSEIPISNYTFSNAIEGGVITTASVAFLQAFAAWLHGVICINNPTDLTNLTRLIIGKAPGETVWGRVVECFGCIWTFYPEGTLSRRTWQRVGP